MIADRLNIASPFDSNRNLSSLASNYLVCRNRELALELSLILQEFETILDRPEGANIWFFIQAYKASALYQRLYFSPAQPHRYLEHIRADTTALDLYSQEQRLIQEGPQSMADRRLEELQLK